MSRTRRTLAIGGSKPEPVARKADFPPPAFEPSGEEGEREGLPAGVRIRWFRNLLARPMLALSGPMTDAVPAGAIVWTPELPGPLYDGAAAVAPLPPAEKSPQTLPEGSGEAPATPTIREAVKADLERVPAEAREGAGAEVEAALAQVGL